MLANTIVYCRRTVHLMCKDHKIQSDYVRCKIKLSFQENIFIQLTQDSGQTCHVNNKSTEYNKINAFQV